MASHSLNSSLEDDKLILLLYKTVVAPKPTEYSIKLDDLQKIFETVGITVEFLNIPTHRICKHTDANRIIIGYYDKPGASYLALMLQRLRNAFCHLNVRLNDDNTYTLQDYNEYAETGKNKLCMFGHIEVNKLFLLLDELNKHKK